MTKNSLRRCFPFTLAALVCLQSPLACGQTPNYAKKRFISILDTTQFRSKPCGSKGRMVAHLISEPIIWDVDDQRTTHIRGGAKALLTVEGRCIDHKRAGKFNWFLNDSLIPGKRYRIWEQEYSKDSLDGEWRIYNLAGTVVQVFEYDNGRLISAKSYWIDGTSLMSDAVYAPQDDTYYVERTYDHVTGARTSQVAYIDGELNGPALTFYPNGQLERMSNYASGQLEGSARSYYPDGTLQEEALFVLGEYHDKKKYYHPNGQLWIEEEYNFGLAWNIVANFDSTGIARDPGTLHNGNGTVLYYNDDGTLRETITYVEGREFK